MQSYKLDENKSSLAVLEINPLSKGHSIVIPKKHQAIEKAPSLAFSSANKMIDHRTDFVDVKRLVQETVNTRVDGIFEEGIAPF